MELTINNVIRDDYYGLTSMYCYFVAKSMTPGPHSAKEERMFQDTDTMFKKTIISNARRFHSRCLCDNVYCKMADGCYVVE